MNFTSSSDTEAPRLTPVVRALIWVSIGVLFVQWTVARGPAIPRALGFQLEGFEGRLWTVVTYMFVHGGLWHLAANMYSLFLFGPRLEHEWGPRRFGWFYLFCGLGGVLLHALLARESSLMIGASGAVFGVMFAYASRWPNDEVFLFGVVPMRVSTLVGLLILLNLAMGAVAAPGGTIAYFTHLGGALAAWFFLRTPTAPSLDELRSRVSRVPDAEESPRAIPRQQPRSRERMDEADEIVARSKAIAKRQPMSRRPRTAAPPASRSDEMNRLLDKISAEGMESLTSDERRFLEEAAKRLRGP